MLLANGACHDGQQSLRVPRLHFHRRSGHQHPRCGSWLHLRRQEHGRPTRAHPQADAELRTAVPAGEGFDLRRQEGAVDVQGRGLGWHRHACTGG